MLPASRGIDYRTLFVTIGLLAASNIFMTIAWYAHLLDFLWAALRILGAVYFIFRTPQCRRRSMHTNNINKTSKP